jgi:RND family efflux transporter MFP subunit
MTPENEILDPYGEPSDKASTEHGIARNVKRGSGGRIFRMAVVVVVALGLTFVFVKFQKTEANVALDTATREIAAEPPTVNVITVEPTQASPSMTLPGETAAWDETTIYSRVNGYVAKWLVDIGDHVTSAQLLATIDTPELDAELLAAKAKLSAAVADVAVKQAKADYAEMTDRRWRDSPKGVVSDQEREDKSAGKAEALANLNASRAQVALQQAEVDRLTVLTGFKEVKAPFDGTIVQRHIDIGDLVTAGSTANTSSLYRLSRVDPIRVFVHVPQSVASQIIAHGAEAVITSPDNTKLRLEGKVARTSKSIDTGSRTMRVEIDLPNADQVLVSGMYVQVSFKFKSAPAFQVPAAALMFKNGGPQVAVIRADGTVDFKSVTIADDEGSVVSLGTGLEPGDRVALNLSSQILGGEKVKARELPNVVAAATPPSKPAR